jgi:hypothetical protein
MKLKRLRAVELEDQQWFPAIVRDLSTDFLRYLADLLELGRASAGLLVDAVEAADSNTVIDLCSGGAGPIMALEREFTTRGMEADFMLTDLFPNLLAFRHAVTASQGRIRYREEPIDARAVPSELTGTRTLFNALHHFQPHDAQAILRDAATNGEPIVVFEIVDRKLPRLLLVFLTPLLVLVATPFIRPMSWRRLLWTYLIPLVPLTCLWDGFASHLRAYTETELEAMAAAVDTPNYQWRVGRMPLRPRFLDAIYLIGQPAHHLDFG